MDLKSKADSLAQQMNQAGITPTNVEQNPAFLSGRDGHDFLVYAEDDEGAPVLGQQACSLHRHGNDWLLFDEYGSEVVPIMFGDHWIAGVAESC